MLPVLDAPLTARTCVGLLNTTCSLARRARHASSLARTRARSTPRSSGGRTRGGGALACCAMGGTCAAEQAGAGPDKSRGSRLSACSAIQCRDRGQSCKSSALDMVARATVCATACAECSQLPCHVPFHSNLGRGPRRARAQERSGRCRHCQRCETSWPPRFRLGTPPAFSQARMHPDRGLPLLYLYSIHHDAPPLSLYPWSLYPSIPLSCPCI